ncbi:MAG: AI-2E family transporter [Thermoleophilaceae bacterium]
MGRWIERHMGMPPATARVVTGNIVHALRQYFLGMTIVGAFNALVVAIGALALGVPLVGTIALVTFLASYVPIIGAWTAGFFVFGLALADQGTSTAFIMALIVFLANGPLQQIVQPIAYGATLELNPLVVFTVTIAAGTLFGMVGLVLAAPLVSAAVHIHAELAEQAAASGEGGVRQPGSLPSAAQTPAQ